MKNSRSLTGDANLLIRFLLWPAAALISSIYKYRESWAKNGIWLFVTFFGFTFIPTYSPDATAYINWLKDFHNTNIDFSTFQSMLYNEESMYVDVIAHLIIYLLAKLTDDYRIMFAVFGFIFGYFYSRNIWYLIDRTDDKLNYYLKVLVVIFALIVPFWFIYAIRFWLAAIMFFFGVIPYLLEGKTKGLWISFLCIFMHFSFIFPVVLFLLYKIAGNRTSIFLALFGISLFISEIDLSSARELLVSYLPDVFHDRINSYANTDALLEIETTLSNANWYAVWHKKALNLSIALLLFVVYYNGKEVWKSKKEMLNLFSFVLLFSGVANILSLIPWVFRFQSVANLFSIAFLFLYFNLNRSEEISKKLLLILSPAFALFVIVSIRIGFQNIGILTFISNPLIIPFLESDVTLLDLIK